MSVRGVGIPRISLNSGSVKELRNCPVIAFPPNLTEIFALLLLGVRHACYFNVIVGQETINVL